MRTYVSEVCITACLDTINVAFFCYDLIGNNVTVKLSEAYPQDCINERVYIKPGLGHGPPCGPPYGLPYGPPQVFGILPIIKKIITTYVYRDDALEIRAIAAIFFVKLVTMAS